jgi:hypothetical protein
MTAAEEDQQNDGPWNPGIQSQVPKELLHLSTIFRPENVFTDMAAAIELQGITGFALSELVVFRPERLALHELLIRVTADFTVPDGSRIEDLGINFRAITSLLFARYVMPHLNSIATVYADTRVQLGDAVDDALDAAVPGLAAIISSEARARARPARLLARLISRSKHRVVPIIERAWGLREIAQLDRMAALSRDSLQELACRTVSRVMVALFAMHGEAWGSRDLIKSLSTDIASNSHCSEVIGRTLEPLLLQAVAQQGYRLLPRQERPVVINTKGPSAAGKSTLRPLQKLLANEIGVDWRDFALISPDIWRKQLLDYGGLGTAYKYAGALAAEEVQIVDQKLDRYMARKHERGDMPHLLIDRFRFDSFAPYSDEAGSNLLTRFGQTVYLFFVITPPELLVERAWNRGLEFGRYKAVDDTLAHSVEAYAGIPDVFFTWVRRTDKRLQFEFLDNTVALGVPPRTVAFGDNHTFNILNVHCISNIERYGRINVNAVNAQCLYPDPAMLLPDLNMGFMKRCIKEFGEVNFADQETGRIYLRIESGVLAWIDRTPLQSELSDADTLASIQVVVPDALNPDAPQIATARYLEPRGRAPTLGQWGTRP